MGEERAGEGKDGCVEGFFFQLEIDLFWDIFYILRNFIRHNETFPPFSRTKKLVQKGYSSPGKINRQCNFLQESNTHQREKLHRLREKYEALLNL